MIFLFGVLLSMPSRLGRVAERGTIQCPHLPLPGKQQGLELDAGRGPLATCPPQFRCLVPTRCQLLKFIFEVNEHDAVVARFARYWETGLRV